jgi:hypothetical protein
MKNEGGRSMKRVVLTVAVGLGLAAFLGPSRAYALSSERLTAHIPFAFDVNGTSLPPGDYLIQRADMFEPNVLEIKSKNGQAGMFVLAENAQPPHSTKEPALVFDRYGKQDFLHAVWVPDGTGARLQTSPAEVRAARVEALGTHKVTASRASSR